MNESAVVVQLFQMYFLRTANVQVWYVKFFWAPTVYS